MSPAKNTAHRQPAYADYAWRRHIGTLTPVTFYVAHVFLIPATIFLFIAAHIFLFRKAGPAGPVKEDQ